jgi:phosphoglycolate phosphatase
VVGELRKAVIFDLDGTLSDSIQSIKYSADKTMEAFGYGPFSVEQYKYFVGDGAANLIRRTLIAGGDTKLEHFEEAFTLYREIFRENCMFRVRPYEGIRELLATLKAQDVLIGVLSNKPHEETVNVIETLFGKGCFNVIQGQKENVAIKPSPEGAFQILEQFGLDASDVVYLGDTATDMKTGKNAGFFTVGALWGFRERKELEESGADAIISHPLELLRFT